MQQEMKEWAKLPNAPAIRKLVVHWENYWHSHWDTTWYQIWKSHGPNEAAWEHMWGITLSMCNINQQRAYWQVSEAVQQHSDTFGALRGATLALIAYDDLHWVVDTSYDVIHDIYTLGDKRLILMIPAAHAMHPGAG